MKKYARVTIAILIMAALGVGYYYYLSNRQPRQDATQQSLVNEQLAQLKTKNIEQNYPESVKEVVNLFMRISKMYYTSSVSDEDLGILASQARLLFDDELKSKQTDAEYLESLKQDIADYKKVNRYISDFKLEVQDLKRSEVCYNSWTVLYPGRQRTGVFLYKVYTA